MLRGRAVTLRPVTDADVPALAAIRATPEVRRWWRGGDDLAESVRADLADDALTVYAVEHDGRLVGAIQWYAETDPDYRHASLDVFLDPAAANTAAIRAYAKVGFRPVGIMRRYERGADGRWHDALLMDLLAEDLAG